MQLPRTLSLEAVFEAEEAQSLPPLPGTSVHGALLRAARGLVCTQPTRQECAGCPVRAGCRYPALFEPVVGNASGGESEVPAPVVLRTDRARCEGPQLIQAGERLHVSTTLIGDAAIADRGLLVSGLHGVAMRGIGIDAEGEQFERRPRLRLVSVAETPASQLQPAAAYQLDLVSPLRLKSGGHIKSVLEARSLWAALVRRTRALCDLYGGDLPELPEEPPFALEQVEARVVEVLRYSARQGRRMAWPGLVGSAVLRAAVEGDGQLAELLGFVGAVQLGKGTLFGFGVVRVERV
jgi:hypothetical protein